jgi:flagellar hook-length control protein FliK
MTIGTLSNFKADVQFKPKTKVDFQVNNDFKAKNSLQQERFGQVFNDVMAAKNYTSSTETSDKTKKVDILQTADLKEALNELGIEFDEALLFVQMGNESIPMDQLLTSENLAEMLAIDLEQLQALMQQLEMEQVDVTNVWAMLEAAPQLLEKLQTDLTVEVTVSADEAVDLLQFMKLAQLIGEKTDTVFTQQTQLINMSDALKQVVTQILPVLQPNVTNQQSQTPLAVVQQVVQPVNIEQKVEAPTQSSNNESLLQHNQQSNQSNRTVTVTLPTNQASQAEALAKEIANLLNRSQMSNSQGTIKLMLKLFPENLGQIRIEIVQQNGVMSARLLATTQVGKELLDSSLNQLKTTLAAQNIQVDRLDVAQALQETDKNFRDQSLFGNFFKQRNDEEDKNEQLEEEEEQKSFEEFLTEEVQA